jgi:predicted DNA-binding mobile mystery protein A
MDGETNKLIISQLDKKIQLLLPLRDSMPPTGWISLFRQTLNMSLSQLAKKMSITSSSLWSLEKREREGTIQIKTLREIGQAMDMTLVYGFIPRDGSLEQLIDRKAQDMAERIVRRTAVTMELEAQENSAGRLQQAIKELAEDLKREMPKSLWD